MTLRLFFTVILGTMLATGPGYAQEDKVMTATNALQGVLSTLKDSVTQLSVDNDQLASKDKDIQSQILQLQLQLGRLQVQGDALNTKAAQLHEANPHRAQQITRLEEENFDLDNHNQKAEGGIKLIQQSLNAGYQEDQQLLLQLKKMTDVLPAPLPSPSPESLAAQHRQKEKLKLMKMINDSQQRQESLHESILDFQKNAPMLPAATAVAHQELLKEQIKDLEAQIAAYPSEPPSANLGPTNQWDGIQLDQMELELKALEENYSQLKDLMEKMSKKNPRSKMTVSEQVEGGKLQSSIGDLNRQSEGLRADLDDLRSQMVDLDKRKSRLEDMIKHLPSN